VWCILDIEEEPLRQHFSVCGGITDVHVIRDKETVAGKGFGYVTFMVVCNNLFSTCCGKYGTSGVHCKCQTGLVNTYSVSTGPVQFSATRFHKHKHVSIVLKEENNN